MATATETRPLTVFDDQCVEMRNIDWSGYTTILRLRGDRRRPRMVYLDGSLYFMTTSIAHERFKKLLDQFFVVVVHALDIPYYRTGSATYSRESALGAVEPDETFYLANAPRVRDKQELDLNVDPPPDLAIEVVHTNPLTAALEVHRRLGVPEVWACEDDGLTILVLQPNGEYRASNASKAFPFLTGAEIFDWVSRPNASNELEWLKELYRWAHEDLARRPRPRATEP